MFMYIFLGGLVVLMLFGIYQVLESRTVRYVKNHLLFIFIFGVASEVQTTLSENYNEYRY